MSNSYFQFKQFRIEQEHCAMKVTTDACIQGAWTPVLPGVNKVLDIGAGTGILSLMLAQRTTGIAIDAIEYDSSAAAQAKYNIAISPWSSQINIIEGDVCNFHFAAKYDLIISNPPFFNNSLLSEIVEKNRARHTVSLSYVGLLKVIEENLAVGGYASVMLPKPEYLEWKSLLDQQGWYESTRLLVCHKPGAPVKRVVCLFGRKKTQQIAEETLIIYNGQNEYTLEFKTLLGTFYLNI